jgi:hypothetical protein
MLFTGLAGLVAVAGSLNPGGCEFAAPPARASTTTITNDVAVFRERAVRLGLRGDIDCSSKVD